MQITYTSVDGFRRVRRFRTVKAAREFVFDSVGPQDLEGDNYAVSSDGVVKVTWTGVTRRELFGLPPSKARLNETTTFYRRGMNLYCRLAGMTYDHERQQIGRVVEVMDNVTGDHHDGFRVRHNEGEACILFNEEAKFATLEDALAHAKRAYLDYLDYLEQDAH
jgi:hypothetical protein